MDRFARGGCLGDLHSPTTGMSQALTKENLSLLPAQGRRGPITSPFGWGDAQREQLGPCTLSPASGATFSMTLRPACFVCSLPAPSPPPLCCRFTFATASPQCSAHTGCRIPSRYSILIPSRSWWERVGSAPHYISLLWASQPHCSAAY